MEQELRNLLRTAPAVRALAGTRINWSSHPQGAGKPYIVLWLISGAEGITLQGRDGLFQGRVQIDCYGRTVGSAKKLGAAVHEVLHGYRGGGFRGVFEIGRRDTRETGTNEAERLFRQSRDYSVNWRKP